MAERDVKRQKVDAKKTVNRGKSITFKVTFEVVESYLTYFPPAVDKKASRRLHQAPAIDVDAEEDDELEDDEGHGKNLLK